MVAYLCLTGRLLWSLPLAFLLLSCAHGVLCYLRRKVVSTDLTCSTRKVAAEGKLLQNLSSSKILRDSRQSLADRDARSRDYPRAFIYVGCS